MSCLFCSCNDHVSHNCDIYDSDAKRCEILRTKKRCHKCLTQLDFDRLSCKDCRFFQKCYICFSYSHHTVFCPDRQIVPHIVLPNIDNDLLSRFLQLLTLEERYFSFLSLTFNPNFIKFKPCKVNFEKEIFFTSAPTFTDFDFVVAEKVCLNSYNIQSCQIALNTLMSSVLRICRLEIYCPVFSSNVLLELLSTKTKILICDTAEIYPVLNIRDIINNAPNLEIIDLHLTNVNIDNSWSDDLLHYSRAKKLRLIISVLNFNFNVESLALLMKKIVANIYFHMELSHNECINERKAFKKITKKLSNHFTTTSSKFKSSSVLEVIITDFCGCTVPKQYGLRNV